MQKREARVARKTNETDIEAAICLDGCGTAQVDTGVPFFDHMLSAFARHGLFDLEVRAQGAVEDVGIVLGQAVAQALGDKRGITRMAHAAVPMDEALVLSALDLSGRGGLYWAMDVPIGAIQTFDTQLGREFFGAFALNAAATLHVQQLAGENAHHLLEAAFKALGRALSAAVAIDPRVEGQLPSTKGAL